MTRPNISLHVSDIEDAFYKIRCDSLQKDCHNVLQKKKLRKFRFWQTHCM